MTLVGQPDNKLRNEEIHNSPCTLSKLTHCSTSVFGDEPRRMLKVIQCFGKHRCCHFQGECVLVECFWKPSIEQVVGGE
jgi:hypothetical protein